MANVRFVVGSVCVKQAAKLTLWHFARAAFFHWMRFGPHIAFFPAASCCIAEEMVMLQHLLCGKLVLLQQAQERRLPLVVFREPRALVSQEWPNVLAPLSVC